MLLLLLQLLLAPGLALSGIVIVAIIGTIRPNLYTASLHNLLSLALLLALVVQMHKLKET